MGENTNIEWAHHSFNPWIGCTKLSPACDGCYADTQNDFYKWNKAGWGPKAPRHRTSKSTWNKPLKWNKALEGTGKRERVFCASLADVFDNHKSIDPSWRADLWQLIASTPNLDWLLLTKRPQNIRKYLPMFLDNIWLGTTVENQEEANRRIPELLNVPVRVRFLSMEPLLGPVDLTSMHVSGHPVAKQLSRIGAYHINALTGQNDDMCRPCPDVPKLHWVIAGGESGKEARPTHPEWFRSLRDQCRATNTPFFFKQWGEWTPGENVTKGGTLTGAWYFNDRWDTDKVTEKFSQEMHRDNAPDVWRVGKKHAGRFLDGVEHNEVPGL